MYSFRVGLGKISFLATIFHLCVAFYLFEASSILVLLAHCRLLGPYRTTPYLSHSYVYSQSLSLLRIYVEKRWSPNI